MNAAIAIGEIAIEDALVGRVLRLQASGARVYEWASRLPAIAVRRWEAEAQVARRIEVLGMNAAPQVSRHTMQASGLCWRVHYGR
jgi:hypothetical protein